VFYAFVDVLATCRHIYYFFTRLLRYLYRSVNFVCVSWTVCISSFGRLLRLGSDFHAVFCVQGGTKIRLL